MTQPTDKHREEAREIMCGPRKENQSAWLLQGDLVNVHERLAVALSSRDREIREVLEGLITHVDFDDGGNPVQHWCAVSDDGDSECDNACLAARGLWNALQSSD